MQPEFDHKKWLENITGEDAQEAYKYFMRPDPNQREFLGPIEEEFDEYTGMTAKFRYARVGMVRGGAFEELFQENQAAVYPRPIVFWNIGE